MVHFHSKIDLNQLTPDEYQIKFSNFDYLEIPQEILNLENLQAIVLENCSLNEIPEAIFSIETLEMLYIINCGFEHLSNSIIRLKNLKEFSLARNNFKEIPNLSQLENLRVLSIHQNPVNELPLWLFSTNLNTLIISGTNIKVLPDEIINLKLEYFDYTDTDINNISNSVNVWINDIRIVKKNTDVDFMKYVRELHSNLDKNLVLDKKLEIRETSNIDSDGFGVFTLEDIPKGTIFYTSDEINYKINDLAWNGNIENYGTKENVEINTNVLFFIDCEDIAWFYLEGRFANIYLKSIKDIKEGEELSRFYGIEYWEQFLNQKKLLNQEN